MSTQPDSSLALLAALQFHNAVQHRLIASGERGSKRRIAKIVGTTPQNYGAIMNGKRTVGMALIFTWIQSAEKELGAMRLVYASRTVKIGFEKDAAAEVA